MRKSIMFAGLVSAMMTSPAVAQTKLEWWHIWPLDGASGKIYAEYRDEFLAANPGVEVEMVQIPSSNFFEKLAASIASGEPPDLFALTYRRLLDFQSNDAIAPIDAAAVGAMGYDSREAFEAAWAPGVLDAYGVRFWP